MVHERNPFVRGGGVVEFQVPFCGACVSLTRRRRNAVWLRAGGAVAIAVAALNLTALLQRALLDTGSFRTAALTRWSGAVVLLAAALFLIRLLPLMAWRRWFFGFEVVDQRLDGSEALVRVADPLYARALAVIYEPEEPENASAGASAGAGGSSQGTGVRR